MADIIANMNGTIQMIPGTKARLRQTGWLNLMLTATKTAAKTKKEAATEAKAAGDISLDQKKTVWTKLERSW